MKNNAFNVYTELEKIQKSWSETNDFITREKEREAIYNKDWANFEEKLYKQYVKDNTGKKFIDIEHIENIKIINESGDIENIKFDVLIVITAKNTGKSTGILFKLINRLHKINKKVFFMRTSKTELEESIPIMVEGENCPFKYRIKGKLMQLTHKKTGEIIGIAKDFKTANSGSGGEFKEYGAILFDECLSWNANKELREAHFYNWAALASSITRNKEEGIKIYCVGNMTHNQGLLSFYGINPEDKLRYICRYDENNPKNVCRILYLNADGIYTGNIKNQSGAVQGMSAEFRHSLTNNTPHIKNVLIIGNNYLWEQFEYRTGFILLNNLNEPILFEVKKTPFDRYKKDQKILFAVKAKPYKTFNKLHGKTYTNDPITAHHMPEITYIENLKDEIFLLYDMAKAGRLRFYDHESHAQTTNLIKKINPEERLKHGL